MSVRNPGSADQNARPSLRAAWISLTVALAVTIAWVIKEADPWDGVPDSWDFRPGTWELALLAVWLVVLVIPVVLGARTIASGRRAAWWPTLLAVVLFAGWGLVVVVLWAVSSIPEFP